MNIIFGTTNKRKIEDLQNVIKRLGFNFNVLSLDDINWDCGDIEENGTTIFENSLIKANAIHEFCLQKGINYPIITDDSGLFVDSLNGEPGVLTARYADSERKENPDLPQWECLNKLLRNLQGKNRDAYYQAAVTCMYPDGTYFQESGKTYGIISESIVEPIKRPYFYSLFKLSLDGKTFNQLDEDEIQDTYRYVALRKVLRKI